MIRTVSLDSYIRENRAKYARIRLAALSSRRMSVRRRPRDPSEQKALLILAVERWKRWQREGKLKVLGPRTFELP